MDFYALVSEDFFLGWVMIQRVNEFNAMSVL